MNKIEFELKNSEITFEALNSGHIPLRRKWTKEPHVSAFWNSPIENKDFEEKYLKKIQYPQPQSFIVKLNELPIGYVQSYDDYIPGQTNLTNSKKKTLGIDQFIGEPDFVNKGLGTRIISLFVDMLFQAPEVGEIVVDPDPKNLRAIRVYEKVGFAKVGLIRTASGEALLMSLKRK